MKAQTIVIARPPEDSEELSAAVAAVGFKPLVEPILRIETTGTDLPDIKAGTPLIFTSSNGVKVLARRYEERSNPVYTVGRNTADEARRAGFTNIETAAGTVDDLVDILLKSGLKEGPMPVYVRGRDVSKDLRGLLAGQAVTIQEFTAYRSVPAENLSLDFLRSLDRKEVAAVMFFSAKGGHVFAGLMEQYDRTSRIRTTKALCISEAVLQSVSVLPFGGSLVAETPDRYGMIKLLEHLKD